MAYNKNSKYLRNAKNEKETKEQPKKSGHQKAEYRSSVMTPRRASELAEAEAAAAENGEAAAEKTPQAVAEEKPKTTYRSSVITPKRAAETADGTAAEKPTKEPAKAAYHKEFRSSVMTPKRARELAIEEGEIAPEELNSVTHSESRKGSDAGLFTGEAGTATQKRAYDRLSAKESNKNVRHRAIVRMVIAIAVLSAISIALQLFGKFHLPYVPNLFTIEFSAVPELIVTIAYGPLFGVAISLVKNLISILINPSSWITSMNNLILECIYLYATALIYARLMKFKDKNRLKGHHRRPYDAGKMLLSSVAGALISLVPQFFITRYIAYPLMEHFYRGQFSVADMLVNYQNSLAFFKEHIPHEIAVHIPEITTISRGIAMVNLTVTFGKLMLVTLVSLLILSLFLPFLQYRDKKAKQSVSH